MQKCNLWNILVPRVALLQHILRQAVDRMRAAYKPQLRPADARTLRPPDATRMPPLALHTVLWSEKPIASAAPKNETPSRVRHSSPPPPTTPATLLLPGVTNGRLAPSSTVLTVVSPMRSTPIAPTCTLVSSRSGP